jgi:hypothetical protein
MAAMDDRDIEAAHGLERGDMVLGHAVPGIVDERTIVEDVARKQAFRI